MELVFRFIGSLWEYHGEAAWVFVTLPVEDAEDIRDMVATPAGFGSVRVEVTVGETTWKTSVFPDKQSGSFVLPIKKDVRTREGIEPGDTVEIEVIAIDG